MLGEGRWEGGVAEGGAGLPHGDRSDLTSAGGPGGWAVVPTWPGHWASLGPEGSEGLGGLSSRAGCGWRLAWPASPAGGLSAQVRSRVIP